MICGDFNHHVGKVANGYEGVHGGHGYGLRNTEGERISSSLLRTILLLGKFPQERKPINLVVIAAK